MNNRPEASRAVATDILHDLVLPRLDRPRKSGLGYMARCPVHTDGNASLSVFVGTKKPVVVLACKAMCDSEAVATALGLKMSDLRAPTERKGGRDDFIVCGMTDGGYDDRHRATATYGYRDLDGALVFAVARCARKGIDCGFRQWRPDPTKRSGKRWSRSLDDGAKVGEGLPYRLRETVAAVRTGRNLWIVEGEKDADRISANGYPATCNAEGAGKWTQAHADHFRDLRPDVMVCADFDAPGWKHAEQVVQTFESFARSIEVVHAASGKDVSDHLDAGLSMGALVSVATPIADPGIADFERWSA